MSLSKEENIYLIQNTWLEKDELKDYNFKVIWNLNECWLNWRYIVKVLVTKKTKEWVSVIKDYICSVTKKTKIDNKNIHYVYLNHLEAEEIIENLNSIK